MQVVDYSFARPNPHDLAAAGYVGAMRYLAPLPNTKVITGDEFASLHANGLSVGLVYEGGAGNALLGAGQGTTDGNVARTQADDLGWPADRPIFFAVDRDVATVQFDAIDAYGRAFGAASGRPVGVYGSWAVVEAMLDRGVATYAWQTAAWSHNVRSKRAVLFQRADSGANPPAGTDVNDVLADDWGGWLPAAQPASTPTTEENDMFIIKGDKSEEWWLTDWLTKRYLNNVDPEVNTIRFVAASKGAPIHDDGNGNPIVVPQAVVDFIPRCDLPAASGGATSPLKVHLTGTLDGTASP